MLSPGILTSQIDSDFKKGIVLRASGGNTILESDIDNEGLILSAKNAIKLNAIGYSGFNVCWGRNIRIKPYLT